MAIPLDHAAPLLLQVPVVERAVPGVEHHLQHLLLLGGQLRGDLRRMLRIAGASALFVTHDQAEALTLADRVAVMRRGAIDQVDRPDRVYAEPGTPFVAMFVGMWRRSRRQQELEESFKGNHGGVR